MSLTEQKKRAKFHCYHRTNGIWHPNCYLKHNGFVEKIGFLDIETTNLSADFGIILSYCIKEENGKIIERVLKPNETRDRIYDKELLKDFCRDVRKFDRVITWYGKKFDIPYLRTRCIFWKLDFPVYHEISHTDAYLVAKYKLKLHSNRLGVVAPYFGIPAKEHSLNPEIWFRCMSGDKRALNFVLKHNEEDVISLEGVWHKVKQYQHLTHSTI